MSLAFAKGLTPRPGRAGAAAAAAPAGGRKPSARIAWVLGLVVRAARVHVPSALARLARGVGARAGARVGGGCVRTRRAARAAGVAGRGGARAIHGGRAAAHRMALLALDHLPVAVAHAFVVRLAEVMAARGRGPILRLLVHRGGLAVSLVCAVDLVASVPCCAVDLVASVPCCAVALLLSLVSWFCARAAGTASARPRIESAKSFIECLRSRVCVLQVRVATN